MVDDTAVAPTSLPTITSDVSDAGVITAVEMLYLLVFGIVALLFIGYLGRLHAASIQVQNTSQAAARAASQQSSSTDARSAALDAVAGSTLATRCTGSLETDIVWSPSPTGAWQGGSVTVTVSCTVDNDELSGIWAPGSSTVRSSDTQPVDRYQR